MRLISVIFIVAFVLQFNLSAQEKAAEIKKNVVKVGLFGTAFYRNVLPSSIYYERKIADNKSLEVHFSIRRDEDTPEFPLGETGAGLAYRYFPLSVSPKGLYVAPFFRYVNEYRRSRYDELIDPVVGFTKIYYKSNYDNLGLGIDVGYQIALYRGVLAELSLGAMYNNRWDKYIAEDTSLPFEVPKASYYGYSKYYTGFVSRLRIKVGYMF